MKYIIIGIIAVIVLSILLHFISKSYYAKYGYGLFGGGIAMLLVIGGVVLAVFMHQTNTLIAVAGGIAAAVIFFILIAVNTKRYGFGAGLGALVLQTIFSVPSLLLVVELFTNKGYSSTANAMSRNRRRAEKARRRRNDRNYY